ncbi:MAG: methyltransferase domain-containing protein [Chloroflexi bacterium]|nr:methyltransferase domain-containing protein [Chloroflexota bacterium]MCC6896744.1 methyltransferase domain-containing protein [Anaerolineae bacterium]
MTISLADIDFLASPTGAGLLQRLATEDLTPKASLSLLTNLRKAYSPEQARAGLEMAQLRAKAVDKFGVDAASMFFTRDALEQASDPLVRRYRAGQIGEGVRVVDACCGIGADSLALARVGADVTGIDRDAVRIAIASYNADTLGLQARFVVGDVTSTLPPADLIFFDPARRDGQGNRIYDVERYQPPLATVEGWPADRVVVKLSPGVDLAQLERYGGRVEFISVDGDLKEAVLWLGAGEQGLTATLLTGYETYHWAAGELPDKQPLSEPRGWLVEPDPALLRAGLVEAVAAQFDGGLLDETIAYLTTDLKPESPWLRSWQILDWMPFNLKQLRGYLRERNVGQVTVKKRGTAVTPETLIPQLKLKGRDSRVLILTRCKGQQIVMICADYVG